MTEIASEADIQCSAGKIFDVIIDFRGEPHLSTMALLDHLCDEATFVDWEQPSPDLPDWQTSYRHLVADGQVAKLTHPSDAHATRAFLPPVEPAGTCPAVGWMRMPFSVFQSPHIRDLPGPS